MTQKPKFYHHKWCGTCGGMTVHDAGTCTRCQTDNDSITSEPVVLENEPIPSMEVKEEEEKK